MNRTRALAEFVTGTGYDDLPEEVVAAAVAPIIDTIGALFAGYASEAGAAALGLAASVPALPESAGRIVGSPALPVAPATAALVNGVLSHALDFDDVLGGFGHPSAPLLAAILSAPGPLSGRDLLAAYALGHEVTARIAQSLGPRHYSDGWHTTSTAGAFGTTAAIAKLRGLDTEGLTTAFGIVASMSSGIQRNFGTETKPLHAGIAARNGVLAVELAELGLTASDDVLENRKGFLDVYSNGTAEPERLDAVGQPFGLVDPGTSLKKYACCYETHRAIDAVLEIQSIHAFDPDEIDRVVVRVPPGDLGPLLYHRPSTVLEAKFSMECCVAAALTDRRIALATFTEAAVSRSDLARLLPRIEAIEDPESRPEDPDGESAYPGSGGFVDVTVHAGGRTASARVRMPSGSPAKPLDDDELSAKFADCLSRVGIPDEPASSALERLRGLPRLDDVHAILDGLTSVAESMPGRRA